MMRYKVTVDFRVIDTTKPFPFTGSTNFDAICECTNTDDAELIATALNAYEQLSKSAYPIDMLISEHDGRNASDWVKQLWDKPVDKIQEGLNDALAFVKGDETAATLKGGGRLGAPHSKLGKIVSIPAEKDNPNG